MTESHTTWIDTFTNYAVYTILLNVLLILRTPINCHYSLYIICGSVIKQTPVNCIYALGCRRLTGCLVFSEKNCTVIFLSISLTHSLSSFLSPTIFRSACCCLSCQGMLPWKWRLTSTLKKKTWCFTRSTSRSTTMSGERHCRCSSVGLAGLKVWNSCRVYFFRWWLLECWVWVYFFHWWLLECWVFLAWMF